MIEVTNLVKKFKVPVREEGVKGMFKTLFSKQYTIKTAVNNISMKIDAGEIVGYIGSNGAGKSTSIKMMCGILTPTSGNVVIDRDSPFKNRRKVAAKIGVVFGQKTQLWWDIPLIESFKVLKEIYRITDEEYRERLEFLSKTLELNDFINQSVRTLSLGQRMRADLAASWLHNPKILFLDEPTIGLDVLVKEKIRKAIKLMNQKYHTTIILTTHDMQDIEDLCSRIIIIEKGSILYDGSLSNIKNKFGDTRKITVITKDEVNVSELENFEGKVQYRIKENNLIVSFDASIINIETVITYIFKNVEVADLKVQENNIEEVVKKLLAEGKNVSKKI